MSGTQWAGRFKGVDEQKSPAWVRSNNIVSVFEAGRSDVRSWLAGLVGGRQAWGRQGGTGLARCMRPTRHACHLQPVP